MDFSKKGLFFGCSSAGRTEVCSHCARFSAPLLPVCEANRSPTSRKALLSDEPRLSPQRPTPHPPVVSPVAPAAHHQCAGGGGEGQWFWPNGSLSSPSGGAPGGSAAAWRRMRRRRTHGVSWNRTHRQHEGDVRYDRPEDAGGRGPDHPERSVGGGVRCQGGVSSGGGDPCHSLWHPAPGLGLSKPTVGCRGGGIRARDCG